MHLILKLCIVGIALIPLVLSTPVSLGDGYYLPSVDNVESHINNLWTNFKRGYGIVYNTTTEEVHRAAMVTRTIISNSLFIYFYRQIKNFVRNLMVIAVKKISVHNTPIFVGYILLHHLI
jgi:hypothetical protein